MTDSATTVVATTGDGQDDTWETTELTGSDDGVTETTQSGNTVTQSEVLTCVGISVKTINCRDIYINKI